MICVSDIYDATLSSVLLLTLGLAVGAVRQSIERTAISFFVWLVVVHCMVLLNAWRIMMPKLRMRDEFILVSELVSDHNRKLRRHTTVETSPHVHITGMSSFMRRRSDRFESQTEPTARPNGQSGHTETPGSLDVVVTSEAKSSETDDEAVLGPLQPVVSPDGSSNYRPVLITEGSPPDESLIMELLRLKKGLNEVTDKILSGVPVTKDGWEALRTLGDDMQHAFQGVQFEWENESHHAECEPLVLQSLQSEAATKDVKGDDVQPRDQPGESSGNGISRRFL